MPLLSFFQDKDSQKSSKAFHDNKKVVMNELSEAVFEGQVNKVRELLVQKVDLNKKINNQGDTLLHISVARDHYAIAKLLLNHGAGINIKNNHGNTALHLSVECHQYKITQLLLSYGPDIYIRNNAKKTVVDYERVLSSKIENNAEFNPEVKLDKKRELLCLGCDEILGLANRMSIEEGSGLYQVIEEVRHFFWFEQVVNPSRKTAVQESEKSVMKCLLNFCLKHKKFDVAYTIATSYITGYEPDLVIDLLNTLEEAITAIAKEEKKKPAALINLKFQHFVYYPAYAAAVVPGRKLDFFSCLHDEKAFLACVKFLVSVVGLSPNADSESKIKIPTLYTQEVTREVFVKVTMMAYFLAQDMDAMILLRYWSLNEMTQWFNLCQSIENDNLHDCNVLSNYFDYFSNSDDKQKERVISMFLRFSLKQNTDSVVLLSAATNILHKLKWEASIIEPLMNVIEKRNEKESTRSHFSGK